jgi:large subunit ribosomal protein L23
MHWREVIRRPVVTEKSNFTADVLNQYTFVVVRIANMPLKRARRLRRMTVRKSGWKKAIVTLRRGDSIELFEGV